MALLAYARLNAETISASIFTRDDEFVICRQAFRWLKDGLVISNGYEMFEMETIIEDNGWELVETYGEHIAICKPKSPTTTRIER